MRRLITVIALCGLASQTMAREVARDNFDGESMNKKVWNDGGGFVHNAAAGHVLLTSSGQNWGACGDNSGAAGLDSDVGYAAFTVKKSEKGTVGGNFCIGAKTYANTADTLVRVNLADHGPGTYEVVWNNSGKDGQSFHMWQCDWSGELGGNKYAVVVNGDKEKPIWGSTDAASNVTKGDKAKTFGFWVSSPDHEAVIDDLVIRDTLNAEGDQ